MECPGCRADNLDANRFCGACGSPLPQLCLTCGRQSALGNKPCAECYSASLDREPATYQATSPGAERRQITVMFCDLVGSTALSGRLDPEDLRDVLAAHRTCIANVVARHNGFLAQYLGDGILAYFGYPQAFDDQTDMAVRAGLDIVEAICTLATTKDRLQVRVGIATGLVVVGDLIGSGAAQERGVIGETPNLAARLQALAEPDTVVIEFGTHRLLGSLFECRDLGPIALKGFSHPVRVWRVLAENAVESRFHGLRSNRTALLGRDEELGLLLTCWKHARRGSGQVILLSGEAGVGKSRLLEAIEEKAAADSPILLRYFCSPHRSESALFPVLAQIERSAAFDRRDDVSIKLDKLESMLRLAGCDEEDPPLLGDLLGLSVAGRYPALDLSPQRRKERTFEALVRQVEHLALRAPLLMIFEDAHWADPTSRELLEFIIRKVETLSVLLVVTFRPEYAARWPGGGHVSAIQLARLDATQTSALALQVAGNKSLPPEMLAEIVSRTDGVPLFIEELTKSMLESGMTVETDDRFVLTRSLPRSIVPTSLQASLLARLDRLAPVREVAQIGAVIGREFTFDLLVAVAGIPSNILQDALVRLNDAELIFKQNEASDAIYSFKHALVQDAAYSTLLKSRRAELHGRIAQTLESSYPEIAERQPETLAHHYSNAGAADRAIMLYLKAGEIAMKQSATAEAIAQYRKAIALLPSMADGSAKLAFVVDLQLGLSRALVSANGYGGPEIAQSLAIAREACEQLGDGRRLYSILAGQLGYAIIRADFQTCLTQAAYLLALARVRNDLGSELIGRYAKGISLLAMGEFISARVEFERCIELAEDARNLDYNYFYSHAITVGMHVYLSFCLLILGYPDQAKSRSRLAVDVAHKVGHPFSTAFASSIGARLGIYAGDHKRVADWAQTSVNIAEEQSFRYYQIIGLLLRGWLLVEEGAVDAAVRSLQQGLGGFRATGSQWVVAFWTGIYALALGAAGDPTAGLDAVREAIDVHAIEDKEYLAELFRIRGRLQLRLYRLGDAEESFYQALQVARDGQARFFELRASIDLARLWYEQGSREKAQNLLVPIYEWFTEGFDVPVLTEARLLLEELGKDALAQRGIDCATVVIDRVEAVAE